MPIAAEIIDKYANHPCRIIQGRLLPINSNARYNGYLKELAAIAGIKRELNTHLARHTFADIMLNLFEFSLEEVSIMLGHKSIRTTQRYAKVSKHKISRTWSRVRSNVFTKTGKPRQQIGLSPTLSNDINANVVNTTTSITTPNQDGYCLRSKIYLANF